MAAHKTKGLCTVKKTNYAREKLMEWGKPLAAKYLTENYCLEYTNNSDVKHYKIK